MSAARWRMSARWSTPAPGPARARRTRPARGARRSARLASTSTIGISASSGMTMTSMRRRDEGEFRGQRHQQQPVMHQRARLCAAEFGRSTADRSASSQAGIPTASASTHAPSRPTANPHAGRTGRDIVSPSVRAGRRQTPSRRWRRRPPRSVPAPRRPAPGPGGRSECRQPEALEHGLEHEPLADEAGLRRHRGKTHGRKQRPEAEQPGSAPQQISDGGSA